MEPQFLGAFERVGHEQLVGGFEPTHLENIIFLKFGKCSPEIRGENMWVAATTHCRQNWMEYLHQHTAPFSKDSDLWSFLIRESWCIGSLYDAIAHSIGVAKKKEQSMVSKATV